MSQPSQEATLVVNLGESFADGNIGNAILEHAAAQLLRQAGEEVRETRDRIRLIRDEEIRAQVSPLVTQLLDSSVQLTDEYGSARGKPVPLRDLIVQKATEILSVRQAHGSRHTVLEDFITREVERVFKQQLEKEVNAAREQVAAAVREQGARVIEETIRRMAR